MRALIVEDDISAALEYEMLLQQLNISDIATVDNIANALAHVKEAKPQFIILDLMLENESGFELMDVIKGEDIDTIIVTGFPKEKNISLALNYPNVISFLTKPVKKEELIFQVKKTVERVRKDNQNKVFFYTSKYKSQKLSFKDIVFFETEGNYTTIHTRYKRHVIKRSLQSIINDLAEDHFFQVYRSIVVNLHFIDAIDYSENLITLSNQKEIPLGMKYKNALKAIINDKYLNL